MVSSLQGTAAQDIAAINQQKMQEKIKDFQDGKINITKNDLKATISDAIKNKQQASATTLDIIDSYDKIDINGDGISFEELEAYKATPAGILGSMGITADSLKHQVSLLDFSNNSASLLDSSAMQPSLLDYSSSDGTVINTANSGINTSNLSQSMQSYLSSYNQSQPSLLNYMT